MTRTYAILDVSPATYEEVEGKLRAAEYGHAFHDDVIDMDGLALRAGVAEHDVVREARDEVVEMARKWRTTPCSGRGTFGFTSSQLCDGENHQAWCDVERARGDLISTLDRLDKLEGRK